MKRRSFITRSSLLGTTAAFAPASLLQAQSSPGAVRADLIIRNARVYTMNVTQPLAEKCTACVVDKAPRLKERPSDHTPIMATLEL